MPHEFYEVLGLKHDAETDDVKKAYKKKALLTHPDRNQNVPKEQAEEGFRKVNNAYEVLSDPEKRKVYDQHGVWPPPQPTAVPSSSQSGFSSSFFRSTPFSAAAPFDHATAGAQATPTEDPFFTTPFGPRPFFQFVNLQDPHDIFRQFFGTADPFGFPQHASPFGPSMPFRSMSPKLFPPSINDMFPGYHHDPLHHAMFGHHASPMGHHPHAHHHHVPQPPSMMPFGMFSGLGPVVPKFVMDDDLFGPPNPTPSSSTFTQFSFTSSGPTSGSSKRDTKHDGPAVATSFSRSTRSNSNGSWTEEVTYDSHNNEHLVIIYPEGVRRYKLNGGERPASEIDSIPEYGSSSSRFLPSFNGRKVKPVIPRKVTLDGPPPEISTGPLPPVLDEDDEPHYPNGYAPGWTDRWTAPVPPGPEPARYPMHEPVPAHGMYYRPDDEHVYAARERYKAELASRPQHLRAKSPRLAHERGKHRARRDEQARRQWEEEGRRMGWMDDDEDEPMDGQKGHKRWWSVGGKK